MMGDAANDAEAICLDEVVGVSLRHGATPCRLGADFVVDGPSQVVVLRTELEGRALAGATWLLGDVCLLCGMVSALTLCGVWAGGFAFLPRGFLYDDPFDARLMTLFSGAIYPLSACAAACHAGSVAARAGPTPACALAAGTPGPVRALLIGVAVGASLGLAGPSDDVGRFGRWILATTAGVCLVRHAVVPLACLASCAGNAGTGGAPDNPALGPRSCVARLLARVGTLWARGLVLVLFMLLAWL